MADKVIEVIRHMSMSHGKGPPGEEKLLPKAQITCQTGFCQGLLGFWGSKFDVIMPPHYNIFE